jgi:hypothetical protein
LELSELRSVFESIFDRAVVLTDTDGARKDCMDDMRDVEGVMDEDQVDTQQPLSKTVEQHPDTKH